MNEPGHDYGWVRELRQTVQIYYPVVLFIGTVILLIWAGFTGTSLITPLMVLGLLLIARSLWRTLQQDRK